jgi:hypothetical protein
MNTYEKVGVGGVLLLPNGWGLYLQRTGLRGCRCELANLDFHSGA